jgi:hypothetical protein
MDAVAVIRETVAHAEISNEPACILSLDFREAFDRVEHTYLFRVLKHYGLNEWIINRIRLFYNEATSSLQINGHISKDIPIRRSVRQGCPLSALLFALSIDPLIHNLDKELKRQRTIEEQHYPTVIAYADDNDILEIEK